MKKILYLLSIIALCISACKKEKVPERTIGINGIYYKAVLLGNKTWMAENYRGPGGISLVSENNTDNGKLYSIAEAKQISLPKGWRIPTVDDYYDLMVLTGAGDPREGYYNMVQSQLVTLMSTTGWAVINGTNTTGFNMSPAGYLLQTPTGASWQDGKNIALFLTNTSAPLNTYWVFNFGFKSDGTVIANNINILTKAEDRGSLRLVKDN